MPQLTRWNVFGATIILLLFVTPVTQAALISDNLLFETQSTQSMWSQGPTGNVQIEEFVGTRWGRYREEGDNVIADLLGIPPSAKKYELGGFIGGANTCVGVDTWYGCAGFRADTTTGAQLKLETSGRVGVYVGAELFGGGVDVTLPMTATVSLPDQVTPGEFFGVTTSGQTRAQVEGEPKAIINAKAPSFRAYVDGVFDTENHFYGKACALSACAEGEFDLDVHLGRFNLVEADSSKEHPWSVLGVNVPGVPLAKYTQRAPSPLNPDGVDETPPIDPTPEPLKPPILLEVEARGLEDKSGGHLVGDNLVLTADHDVLDAKWSLTGYVEKFLRPPGSPGVLKNKIPLIKDLDPIPDIEATYTVANIEVGPVLSMQQVFDLNPVPAVQLRFDAPVTRMELVQTGTRRVKVGEVCVTEILGVCVDYDDVYETRPTYSLLPVTHEDGIVEILLGQSAELAFNEGIGQLLGRTYVLSESTLVNEISLRARLELTAEFGCLAVPGIGSGCINDNTWPTNNLTLGSHRREFAIGGFNEISYAGGPQFNDTGGAPDSESEPVGVPLPGTLSLWLLGLVGIASASRPRRTRMYRFAC